MKISQTHRVGLEKMNLSFLESEPQMNGAAGTLGYNFLNKIMADILMNHGLWAGWPSLLKPCTLCWEGGGLVYCSVLRYLPWFPASFVTTHFNEPLLFIRWLRALSPSYLVPVCAVPTWLLCTFSCPPSSGEHSPPSTPIRQHHSN